MLKGTFVFAALLVLLGSVAANAASERSGKGRTAEAASTPRRIVCGTRNGCQEVPHGCRYQKRRTGNGSVVVVLCKQ